MVRTGDIDQEKGGGRTNSFAIRSNKLFLEVSKARTVPDDVVLDVPLKILNPRDSTLEECMQDDFL
jgi:hypothetical protein